MEEWKVWCVALASSCGWGGVVMRATAGEAAAAAEGSEAGRRQRTDGWMVRFDFHSPAHGCSSFCLH
jgi:hypothetical protein